MPVGSMTVTWALRPSALSNRLATSVPPTPPPRTTISAGIGASPRLAHDEPRVPVFGLELDQLVLCLRDPRGDVGLRALVAREHLVHLADLTGPDRADQRHQRTGARHAACIDRPC